MPKFFGARVSSFLYGLLQTIFMVSLWPNFETNPVASFARDTLGEWTKVPLIGGYFALIIINVFLIIMSIFGKFVDGTSFQTTQPTTEI